MENMPPVENRNVETPLPKLSNICGPNCCIKPLKYDSVTGSRTIKSTYKASHHGLRKPALLLAWYGVLVSTQWERSSVSSSGSAGEGRVPITSPGMMAQRTGTSSWAIVTFLLRLEKMNRFRIMARNCCHSKLNPECLRRVNPVTVERI